MNVAKREYTYVMSVNVVRMLYEKDNIHLYHYLMVFIIKKLVHKIKILNLWKESLTYL